MGEVCIALRENGKIKTAVVHKCLLNAFQDVRWFTEERKPHPLDALFKEAGGPLAPYDYGLVVIDRDTRWMGSWQSYMGFGQIEIYSSGDLVRAVEHLDVDAELAKVDPESWASFYMLDAVRTRILVDAHANGAVAQFMDADWSEDDPQWQPLSSLGTDNLPDAVDELNRLRRARKGGRCTITRTFFRFLSEGWTIDDYDPQDKRPQDFIDALIERKLVSAEEIDAWYNGKN